MVVDVAPVRVADRADAIRPAAIAGVRHAHALSEVRRWEPEGSPIGEERLNLACRKLRSEAGAGRRIHEALWRSLRIGRCDGEANGDQANEGVDSEDLAGSQKHFSSRRADGYRSRRRPRNSRLEPK